MPKKFLEIREKIEGEGGWDDYSFETYTTEIISRMRELEKKHPQYSKIYFQNDSFGDYKTYYDVYGVRLENAQERLERIKTSREHRERRKEMLKKQEQEELSKLKDLLIKHKDKVGDLLK